MRIMFLTPVKVDDQQYGIYDIADVSEQDGQDMLNRGWGVVAPDEAKAGSSHFTKPKPVATLQPDPHADKE